jgi:beta-galactosidase
MGRLNFGHEINNQRKGLNGEVLIDAKVHKKWKMFPLEFKEKFIEGLKTEKWKPFENTKFPAIYRAVLDIKDTPKDTFMKLDNWTKIVVFVNEFNVRRLEYRSTVFALHSDVIPKNGKNEYLFI